MWMDAEDLTNASGASHHLRKGQVELATRQVRPRRAAFIFTKGDSADIGVNPQGTASGQSGASRSRSR